MDFEARSYANQLDEAQNEISRLTRERDELLRRAEVIHLRVLQTGQYDLGMGILSDDLLRQVSRFLGDPFGERRANTEQS